jgi:tetratricopeptide (TPR) repeat protein
MDGWLKVCKAQSGIQAGTQAGQPAKTQALNPPYMKEFPSLERVRAELKGADAMDTAAMHMGAFWQLQQMINELAGPRRYRNQLTPDEGRLLGLYALGYQEAGKPYTSYPDRPKWFKMHSFYEVDAGFLDDLLNQFFSPGLRAQYLQLKGEKHARAVARSRAAANTRAQIQTGGGGQPDTQSAAQAAQQLAQGLSQIIMSMAGNLPAAQPGAGGYVTAASAEEAKEQWQRALGKSNTFESSDEFVLMFFQPGYATMMCHGNLSVPEKPYTVEAQNGRVDLTFFKGEAGASQAWLLGLRQDGALVSQNARTLQLFGKEKEGDNYKYKPCGVDVLTPKPRAGTTSTAATKPPQLGAAAATHAGAYVADGNRYIQTKDYPKAIEAYKKAVDSQPNLWAAQRGLGISYFNSDQFEKAIAPLKEALRLKPNDAELSFALGFACYETKQYADSLAAFQEAARLQPNDADNHYWVGELYLVGFNQSEKAIPEFRESLRLRPNDARTLGELGAAHGRLTQHREAVAAFQQAIRIKPQLVDAYRGLALTYVDMGKDDEAHKVAQSLAAIDQKKADELVGEILAAKITRAVDGPAANRGSHPAGRPPGGVVRPSRPAAASAEAYYAQGEKYYELKDYSKAVEAHKKAIALKPSMAEAHDGLGLAYHGLKQYPAAVAAFKEAIRLRPKDPLPLYHLADTYFALEKRKEMLEVAEKLEPLDEQLYQQVVAASVEIDPVFYKVMGEKALEKGDLTTAGKAFQEALRLQPEYAEASEGLGKAYFRLKQFPNAVTALKEAVRLKPDFAEAHFGLGMTYVAMGRKGDALQVYGTLQRLEKERAEKLHNAINRMSAGPQPARLGTPPGRGGSNPPR